MGGCSCTLLGSWTVARFLPTSVCLDLIYCDVMLKALFAEKVLTLAHEPNGILTQGFRKCCYQNNFKKKKKRLGSFVNFSVKLQKVIEAERNNHRVISFL